MSVQIMFERFHIIAERFEGEIHEYRLGVPLDFIRKLQALCAGFGNAFAVMLSNELEHAGQIVFAL